LGYLLDSNVLIDFERGRIDLDSNIAGRESEEFFISVITASELLHGVWRATNTEIRNRRSAFVEAILSRTAIINIDITIARIHSRLWADLQSEGNMIGVHDSWIAATCLAYGLTIVTANIQEFHRIPGLTCESWLKQL